MNWGKGIVGGMIIFMLFILSMCIYMFKMPADEYDHQYYEKGLRFDRDYQREMQVGNDHAKPAIKQNGQTLDVKFVLPASGSIKFVRPSSQAMDRSFLLNTGQTTIAAIPLSTIKAGQWQLVVEWQSGHKLYLYQQEFYIQ